jgi:hypothetical protein
MTTKDFDTAFDDGDAIIDRLDLSAAVRPNLTLKRVNVDFPAWMVTRLDREARKRGVSRQALIKLWLADKLEAA